MNNRAWMYDMYLPDCGGYKREFFDGVDTFVGFASSQICYMDGDKIKCPCSKCRNLKFWLPDEVKEHLYRTGFMHDYYWWTAHGEPPEPVVPQSYDEQIPGSNRWDFYNQLNAEQRMVLDMAGPNFVPPPRFATHNVDVAPNSGTGDGQQEYPGMWADETADDVNEMREDLPADMDSSSQRFWDVLKAADVPVWEGCKTHTVLSFVSRLMSLKCEYNVPQSVFNGFLQLYDEVLPEGHQIPTNYYQTEKVVSNLGLPVERIDMCPNGCMLYWKDAINEECCKFCGHDRFEYTNSQNKGTPHKVLFYFPLTPRLQRLYASDATTSHMTWHANHESEQGIMCHPSDGDAWKCLNSKYPDFASEPRL